MALPKKPEREDEPVKLEPVERVVMPESFANLLIDLSSAYFKGFGTIELETLFVSALESYDPHALALNMGQLICVVRLLGWQKDGRFTDLIRRLAGPCVQVSMVQERYDVINDTDDSRKELELFGILLQILKGEPPRRQGPSIDWLKDSNEKRKTGGGVSPHCLRVS